MSKTLPYIHAKEPNKSGPSAFAPKVRKKDLRVSDVMGNGYGYTRVTEDSLGSRTFHKAKRRNDNKEQREELRKHKQRASKEQDAAQQKQRREIMGASDEAVEARREDIAERKESIQRQREDIAKKQGAIAASKKGYEDITSPKVVAMLKPEAVKSMKAMVRNFLDMQSKLIKEREAVLAKMEQTIKPSVPGEKWVQIKEGIEQEQASLKNTAKRLEQERAKLETISNKKLVRNVKKILNGLSEIQEAVLAKEEAQLDEAAKQLEQEKERFKRAMHAREEIKDIRNFQESKWSEESKEADRQEKLANLAKEKARCVEERQKLIKERDALATIPGKKKNGKKTEGQKRFIAREEERITVALRELSKKEKTLSENENALKEEEKVEQETRAKQKGNYIAWQKSQDKALLSYVKTLVASDPFWKAVLAAGGIALVLLVAGQMGLPSAAADITDRSQCPPNPELNATLSVADNRICISKYIVPGEIGSGNPEPYKWFVYLNNTKHFSPDFIRAVINGMLAPFASDWADVEYRVMALNDTMIALNGTVYALQNASAATNSYVQILNQQMIAMTNTVTQVLQNVSSAANSHMQEDIRQLNVSMTEMNRTLSSVSNQSLSAAGLASSASGEAKNATAGVGQLNGTIQGIHGSIAAIQQLLSRNVADIAAQNNASQALNTSLGWLWEVVLEKADNVDLRVLNASLSILRERMDHLNISNATIATINEYITNITEVLNSKADAATVNSTLAVLSEALDSRIERVEGDVRDLQDDMGVFSNQVQATENKASEALSQAASAAILASSASEEAKNATAGIRQINETVQRIQGSLAAAQERLDVGEGIVGRLYTDIQQLNTSLGALAIAVSGKAEIVDLQGLNASLVNLQERINGWSVNDSTPQAVVALNTQIIAINQYIANITGILNDKADAAAVNNALAALNERMAAFDSRIQSVEAEVAIARGEAGSAMVLASSASEEAKNATAEAVIARREASDASAIASSAGALAVVATDGVSQVNATVQGLQGSLAVIQQQLDRGEGIVGALYTAVQQLNNSFGALAVEVSGKAEAVDLQRLNTSLLSLQERIDGWNVNNSAPEAVVALTTQIIALNQRVDNITNLLNSKADAVTVNSALSALNATVVAFDSRVQSVEVGVDRVEEELAVVSNNVTGLDGRVRDLEQSPVGQELSERLDTLNGTVLLLGQQGDATAVRVLNLSQGQIEQQTTITLLQTNISDVMKMIANFSAMQERLNQLELSAQKAENMSILFQALHKHVRVLEEEKVTPSFGMGAAALAVEGAVLAGVVIYLCCKDRRHQPRGAIARAVNSPVNSPLPEGGGHFVLPTFPDTLDGVVIYHGEEGKVSSQREGEDSPRPSVSVSVQPGSPEQDDEETLGVGKEGVPSYPPQPSLQVRVEAKNKLESPPLPKRPLPRQRVAVGGSAGGAGHGGEEEKKGEGVGKPGKVVPAKRAGGDSPPSGPPAAVPTLIPSQEKGKNRLGNKNRGGILKPPSPSRGGDNQDTGEGQEIELASKPFSRSRSHVSNVVGGGGRGQGQHASSR